jgi:hypothetical protein
MFNYRSIRFLKCPYCDFVNVHEDTIMHHIKYTEDDLHNVEVEKVEKPILVIID